MTEREILKRYYGADYDKPSRPKPKLKHDIAEGIIGLSMVLFEIFLLIKVLVS